MTPKQLKSARVKLGLTQTEFGAAMGITKTSIHRKERGTQTISKGDALAIEALLNRKTKGE